ncbi:retrovirus-related Pol polyprotein from transposon 17.6 [Trichonephila clavipes]|nr:retrovirus-related Pol polyprotein from transposon 17.6 [Trichonephila clavipes]
MEQFVKTYDQCQRDGKPNGLGTPMIKKKLHCQKKASVKHLVSRMGFPVKYNVTRVLLLLVPDYRVFERFGILVRHSSVYHPQSNPVERFHRTLKRLLRVICLDAGSEWNKHLPSILLVLRTVSHESTRVYTVRVGVWENLRTPETLVMEHWMESEEEGDLVTEYMFKVNK